MKHNTNKIIALMCVVITLFLFSGCGTKSKVVGEYEGTAGSYLKLNKNGTCYYGEDDDTGAGQGTWYIEDKTLYIELDIFDYDVYASIEEMDDGFLLKADSSRWNDEYFSKIKE